MSASGFTGFAEASSAASDFNAHTFHVKQLLARVSTATPVKVLAVTNSGGLTPAGTLTVQPLVNQVDGAGNSVPHAPIHGVMYSRAQGGSNAVIMDPEVGDIGVVVFASRDISSVIANKGQANPGSSRRHDQADAMYMGGALNGTPTQFAQFNADGITLTSPVAINLNAPILKFNGNIVATGTITSNGHDIGSTHEHTLTQPGTGNSGVPV